MTKIVDLNVVRQVQRTRKTSIMIVMEIDNRQRKIDRERERES